MNMFLKQNLVCVYNSKHSTKYFQNSPYVQFAFVMLMTFGIFFKCQAANINLLSFINLIHPTFKLNATFQYYLYNTYLYAKIVRSATYDVISTNFKQLILNS